MLVSDTVPSPPDVSLKSSLGEIARVFLRLGFTAFGGPAAHIALMRQEFVERRKWLTEAEFVDLLGAANLVPGPNSTELAIHIGYKRGGWAGLLIAGLCFIIPAALFVSLFAWGYVRFGRLPAVQGVLYGAKPVIVAVVAQAIWGLVKTALKTRLLIALGLVSLAFALMGVDELSLLFGTGLITGIVRWWQDRNMETEVRLRSVPKARSLLRLVVIVGAMIAFPTLLTIVFDNTTSGKITFGNTPLFLFFLKVGSVLYGSGYVLLAFLRDTLVSRWGWLTEAQLLDATAVGQVTPGPVFTTATFVGYVLGGPISAFVATLGIFLPAFVFVAISGPLVPRLRRSPLAGAFLDGVNASALALMAAVLWYLGRAAFVDLWTVLLAACSAFLLIRFRINSAYLLLAGALLGLVITFINPVLR